MRRPLPWVAAALLVSPPALALAQVSTATASFAQISLTGVDLAPDDAFVPLAFGMADLLFTYRYDDVGLGTQVTVVRQAASLPYTQTTSAGGGGLIQVSNDGLGQVALTATASGNGARASGAFTIEDNPLAPLVILPHTRYTLSVSYAVSGVASGYDPSGANALDNLLMVLLRPGMEPQGQAPFFSAPNSAGLATRFITNDSDVAGTLVLRINATASAQAGVVPEPATGVLWLLGLAAIGNAVTRRRRPSTPTQHLERQGHEAAVPAVGPGC